MTLKSLTTRKRAKTVLSMLRTLGVVTLIAACSPSQPTPPAQTAADYSALPVLDLVATHAFDTPARIKYVGFVPNRIASWTGKLILIDDLGKLRSTSIEGRNNTLIDGQNRYVQVIGFSREKDAGLFLALTEAGELRGYVESSDEGDFSPILVTMPQVKVQTLCSSDQSTPDQFIFQSQSGSFHKAYISDTTDAVITLSLMDGFKPENDVTTRPTQSCAHAGDKIFTSYEPKSAVTAMTLSDQDISLLSIPTELIFPSDSPKTKLSIGDGLSISGLSGPAGGVFSTGAAFGGTAFDAGIVVIPEADHNRLIVLSANYLAKQIDKFEAP